MAKFSSKSMGKENGPASVYAKPHTEGGKTLEEKDIGFSVEMPTRKNWTPLNGGVSIGNMDNIESTGIETRGNGAATKGRIARGPMA
jgi:hypothetical protein